MQVSVAKARDRLTQLLKAVEDGAEVTITRHGEPVADLVRTRMAKKVAPKLGTLAGRVIVDANWKRKPETNEDVEAWLRGDWE